MTGHNFNGRASDEQTLLQKNQARGTPMNAQRAWRAAVERVQLSLGGRLDSGVVLEELLVQLDEVLALIGRLGFREPRLDRPPGLARPDVEPLPRRRGD